MKEKEERAGQRPSGLFPLPPITVVVGHYGVGKTNLSLNLALDSAKDGAQVALIDLDVVNPYFRSSDYNALLEEAGIEVVAPVFARSALDVPSLSGRIEPVIEAADEGHKVILDVGGDEVGATTLGRFAEKIRAKPYMMVYVVNAYRNLTQDLSYAQGLLHDIEAKSGLRATGIVNNSHLKEETDEATIAHSLAFADHVSAATGLPIVATTVPASLQAVITSEDGRPEAFDPESSTLFPNGGPQGPYLVQVYVHTPWEQ